MLNQCRHLYDLFRGTQSSFLHLLKQLVSYVRVVSLVQENRRYAISLCGTRQASIGYTLHLISNYGRSYGETVVSTIVCFSTATFFTLNCIVGFQQMWTANPLPTARELRGPLRIYVSYLHQVPYDLSKGENPWCLQSTNHVSALAWSLNLHRLQLAAKWHY